MNEIVRAPGATKETTEEFNKRFQQIRDLKAQFKFDLANDPSVNRKETEKKLLTLDNDLEALVAAFKDWKQRTGGKAGELETTLGAKRGKGGRLELAKEIPVKKGIIRVSEPVNAWAKLHGLPKSIRNILATHTKDWLITQLKDRGFSDDVIKMVKENKEQCLDLIIEETINEM